MLTGPTISITPLRAEHVEDYLVLLGDPETTRLTGSLPSDEPVDPSVTRQRTLAWLGSRADQHDRADWAIVRNADQRFVGEVVLNEFDRHSESASLRIALGPSANFGHGYGTEATRLAVDYAFDVIGLHRVGLEVFDFNPRARRVYEKCGFRVEGVLRDALRWDDAWVDAIVMSIVATDRH